MKIHIKSPIVHGLVWFKPTDLRIRDNEAIFHAHNESEYVFHTFIFDHNCFKPLPLNKLKLSSKRLLLLCESLIDLDESLRRLGSKLHFFTGPSEYVIKDIMDNLEKSRLYFHEELAFDENEIVKKTKSFLNESSHPYNSFWGGNTLYNPSDLNFPIDELGMFTEFRKSVEPFPCREPFEIPLEFKLDPICEAYIQNSSNYLNISTYSSLELMNKLVSILSEKFPSAYDDFFEGSSSVKMYKGGETSAWERLNYYVVNGEGKLSCYKETRNELIGIDYSSKLSVWLALGCITSRQIAAEVKRFTIRTNIDNESTKFMIFELLWRDYMKFYGLKYGVKLFALGGPQGEVGRNKHKWGKDIGKIEAWKRGLTGYPFIDANMREMLHTGYMSNRGRQVVASFLVRDLEQDWRIGAEYFESQLLDYDVCSNYGNWQYSAGVGADPRDDRYFNILKQAKLYDPNAKYIKIWCPEIAHVPTDYLLDPTLITEEIREKYEIPEQTYPKICVELLHKTFKPIKKASDGTYTKKEKARLEKHGKIQGLEL